MSLLEASSANAQDPMYNFIWDGKEISLRRSTITAERLGRYFHFEPSTVYIQEEFGSRVEFPNENGKINLTGFLDGTSFSVFGDDCNTAITAASSFASTSGLSTYVPSSSTSFATIAKKPSWSWSQGGGNKGKASKEPKVIMTVKVVYAEMSSNGKPQPSTKQTFVPIYREEDANVDYITSFVSNSMGEKRLVLVGNNGIPYKDEAGTRGIAFWKKGSRKVYAVQEVNPRKTKKPHSISFDDSDDSDHGDSQTTCRASKQRRSDWDRISSQLQGMEAKINLLETTVDETKSEVLKVLVLTKDSRVPVAIKNIVKESFSCLICKSAPMKTPVIASRCCGAIIGCSSCVDTWYATGADIFSQTCPHCRGERAYSNTFRLNGLDDFLNKLREICCENE